MRKSFLFFSALVFLILFTLRDQWEYALPILYGLSPILILGLYDVIQKKSTILKNFPILGHGRYLMEAVRPELQQYFVETNHDGKPISREYRSIVYQRAKGDSQTLPFGTQRDVYAEVMNGLIIA